MPVKIDRETRLEETLHAIVKLAEQCRDEAVEHDNPLLAAKFHWIRTVANEAAGSPPTTSFVKEFDPETVGDEELRRELVLSLSTDWTLTVHVDAFADTVVRQADAIIERMKR